MAPLVSELRILLFLNNLSDGDVLVKEVVLSLRLVAVLLLDSLSAFQLNCQAEVLVDTLTKVFVIEGVQDGLLIFI